MLLKGERKILKENIDCGLLEGGGKIGDEASGVGLLKDFLGEVMGGERNWDIEFGLDGAKNSGL